MVAVEDLVAAHPHAVVVVDEAYIDFGGESAIPLIHRYSNLLVIRTFSKSRSLAGLRIGFAVGHVDLIEALNCVKNSFNAYPLDRIAITAAIASYNDEIYFQTNRIAIMTTQDVLVQKLSAMGFEVLPSIANFVFMRHPAVEAPLLAKPLREMSIFVRHFAQPRINQYLRVTVGTATECARLVDALSDMVGKQKSAFE